MEDRRARYEIIADLLDIVARRGACGDQSLLWREPARRKGEKIVGYSSLQRLRQRREPGRLYDLQGYEARLEYLEAFRQMRKLFAALDEKSSNKL